jgi:hypothetical protein
MWMYSYRYIYLYMYIDIYTYVHISIFAFITLIVMRKPRARILVFHTTKEGTTILGEMTETGAANIQHQNRVSCSMKATKCSKTKWNSMMRVWKYNDKHILKANRNLPEELLRASDKTPWAQKYNTIINIIYSYYKYETVYLIITQYTK